MTALVIGASGQVGRSLTAYVPSDGSWVATSRNGKSDGRVEVMSLDVTDVGTIRELIVRLRPEVVINASAYTAVDRAEAEPDLAFRVNALAPAAMARACREADAFFVHYSTDYVFDGTAGRPYSEDDPVAPLGVYGRSKLEGETAVLDEAPDSLVLRTAWVYSAHGRNFLLTMLRLAAERPELRVVDDQVGAPTTADFVARATLELVAREDRPTGRVNVVCAGSTSWCGFARAIVEGAFARELLPRDTPVVPIGTRDFPTPAKRPAYSVLSTARLSELNVSVPAWQDELDRMLDRVAGRAAAPR